MLECRELRNHFTHAIIDEAGQSHELGVLVPMALVGSEGQTIMAGDPMQMPPIVINKHANDRGLNISMLSRLLGCYSNIERFVRTIYFNLTQTTHYLNIFSQFIFRVTAIKNHTFRIWYRN